MANDPTTDDILIVLTLGDVTTLIALLDFTLATRDFGTCALSMKMKERTEEVRRNLHTQLGDLGDNIPRDPFGKGW